MALALGAAAFAQHRPRASFDREWTTQREEAEAHRRERQRLALRIGHERGANAFREAGREFERFPECQIEHHRASADRHRSSSRSLELVAAAMACAPALVAAVRSWSAATRDAQRARVLQVLERDTSEFRQVRSAAPAP